MSNSKRGTDIKKPKFNNKRAIVLAFTKHLDKHMNSTMAAKDEKSKAEAYIMVLVKKNGIERCFLR